MLTGLHRLVVPALLVGIVVAILISLGNWQMRRLAWKQDLIDNVTTRTLGPVVELPAAHYWSAMGPQAFRYRRYRLTGRFLHDFEAWVFTSLPNPRGPFGGPGYWIMTPFELHTGGIVWVNRGFAPQGRHSPPDRADPLLPEKADIVGLYRGDETPGLFIPSDTPDQNIFYARNTGNLSAAKGIRPPVAPFTIDLAAEFTPDRGLPQAGETRMQFPNRHLGYALTWYGLAVACIGVFILFARSRLGKNRT